MTLIQESSAMKNEICKDQFVLFLYMTKFHLSQLFLLEAKAFFCSPVSFHD